MGAFTAAEVMFTTRPKPRSAMPSTTALISSMGVSMLASTALSQSSRVQSRKSPGGGPPPGDFRQWTRETWLAAITANMLTPIELMKATVDAMAQRGFGRIVNITSAMVKAPQGPMGLSCGARAGLTSACKALSAQVAWANVTINNLLPERIDTDRQVQIANLTAAVKGITVEQAYDEMKQHIPAHRLGRPEEMGEACAFLCGAGAGYITGQNLQLDGGAYPGLV